MSSAYFASKSTAIVSVNSITSHRILIASSSSRELFCTLHESVELLFPTQCLPMWRYVHRPVYMIIQGCILQVNRRVLLGLLDDKRENGFDGLISDGVRIFQSLLSSSHGQIHLRMSSFFQFTCEN